MKVVDGHAIFWEPPSRASLGKHNKNLCNVPENDDHMSLWCGSRDVQHYENDGKCGVCGDSWGATDRPHEAPGGKFATGIIGRSYHTPGSVIDVAIDVVANHRGFFAFMLCQNNNPDQDPTQECFQPLKLADGSEKYMLTASGGIRANLKVRLPANVTCWQCILQWTYVTGNSWGYGPQTFDFSTPDCLEVGWVGKLGCGPQETFRGCADVCVGPGCPTKPCQKAQPFSDNIVEPASTEAPQSNEGYIEPLCLQVGVKDRFWSQIGDYYCQATCLFKPMAQCNLYLCDCTPEAHWNDQRRKVTQHKSIDNEYK